MRTNLIIASLLGFLAFSCASPEPESDNSSEKSCGYEMSYSEINEISTWVEENPSPYEVKNGSEIYSEINDSIRLNLSDSISFELFLTKLTDHEVAIDSYVPNDEEFMREITCVLMNTAFSNLVPKKRKIRFYLYTNPNGSGNTPFKTAIKNYE